MNAALTAVTVVDNGDGSTVTLMHDPSACCPEHPFVLDARSGDDVAFVGLCLRRADLAGFIARASELLAQTVPSRDCPVCGHEVKHGRWATRPVLCLADANVLHHVGCRDGCDGCVAAARIGVRS